jgi:hypothetical protein
MKRYLSFTALFLITLVSILYIIPSRNALRGDKYYFFHNLPSAFGEKSQNLRIRIPGVSETFKYQIESLLPVNKSDWNDKVYADQKTVEARLKSFLADNFEVRVEKVNDRALFTIYTLNSLGSYTNILNSVNNDFKITVETPTITADQTSTTQSGSQEKTLNLTRSDFDYADINVTTASSTDTSGSNVKFEVHLPIGLLVGAEKINLLKAQALNGSQIDLYIGGRKYQGGFLPNSNGSITDLVINSVTSLDEAAILQTFLNTSSLKQEYTQKNSSSIGYKNGKLKFIAFIILLIIGAIILNKFTIDTISIKKLSLIFAFTMIGFGVSKLFGLTIGLGYTIVLTTLIIFTLFNTRFIYISGLFGILLLIKVMGLLYFIHLNWDQILVLAAVGLLFWMTRNIKKGDKIGII